MGLGVEVANTGLEGEKIRAVEEDWLRKNSLNIPFPILYAALCKSFSCLVLIVGQESHWASQA